ncbi:hypothetical protein ACFLTS_01300 [Chloroflexota bacterium]
MRLRLILPILLVLLLSVTMFTGCSGEGKVDISGDDAAEGSDTLSSEDLQAIRDMATAYWEAFNAYDAETAMSFMEDSWRVEHEEALRDELTRLKNGFLFIKNVKLDVTEESPPTVIGDNEVEMLFKLGTPLGDKHSYFRIVKIGDEWKVCFSEER